MPSPLSLAPVSAPPARVARRSLSRTLAVWGVLIVATGWIAVAVFLRWQRAQALESEARQNMNLARSLQETTLRVFATADQATLRLGRAVQDKGYDAHRVALIANETGLVASILVQLSFIDAEGRFVGSNLDRDGSRTGHIDLREREHVRAHLAPDSLAADVRGLMADGLFIGKPVLGKVSGRWTIQLSRKIMAADGGTLGVVVASLDPDYFETVYRNVELGSQGAVALVGGDRVIRARVAGGQSAGMGQKVSDSGPLGAAAGGDSGRFQLVSGVDGVPRVTAYHRVPGFPVYVSVGTSLEHALSDWRATSSLAIGLMSALTGLTALGLTVVAKGVRQLELSEARAQAANQEN